MTIDHRTIEGLKSEGLYFTAGALAAELRAPRAYGCHYGARSTRDRAAADFLRGYDAAR